jgi:hypothetical protein
VISVRQSVIVACLLAFGSAAAWALAERERSRVIEAGFWFEAVSFESSQLPDPITPLELERIKAIAKAELDIAFAGLRLTFTSNRDATYRIRVVQRVQDMRKRSPMEVAGESRAISGLGGQGTVSFGLLASYALAQSPAGADRETRLAAIGRGVGRAAVHELAHMLLPTAAIHAGAAVDQYEYEAAYRYPQYYGEMRWGRAWPLLVKRVGER